MGEGTTPSDWHAIDRRHRAAYLLGAAVVLVSVVVGAVALTGRGPSGASEDEATRTITPAEQTAETTIPVPAYEPTATPGITAGDGGSVSANGQPAAGTSAGSGPGAATAPVAPARIAYRRDGWLCVAAPGGTSEQRVAASTAGVFSLAPDSTMIASVDDDGELRLYSVATGETIVVGPAERDRPSWAPDSAWLVYTAPGQRVTRVGRDGGGRNGLLVGRMPVIAQDAVTVVAVSPDTREPAVLVQRGGIIDRRVIDAPITGLACSAARIYLGTGPDANGVSSLRSMPLSGPGERLEATSRTTARGVSVGSPLVSPNDRWVAYAEQGDDGYSRVYVIPVSGGMPKLISGRRDAYLLQWAGTADALLLAEGNLTQGETTALVSADVPSAARRVVVEGAGR